MKLTEKLFGTHSERELKRIAGTVDKIESLRPQMQQVSDEELRVWQGMGFTPEKARAYHSRFTKA